VIKRRRTSLNPKKERRKKKEMYRKYIAVATLICLMLISAFATTGITTVKAESPIVLHLVQDSSDYDGMHAVGHSIKEELAKIGITVEIDYRETGVFDDTVFGQYWNYTWDDAPNLGWDMFIRENWCMPNDLLWFESMLAAVGMPPAGYQRMSWNNTKADALLRAAYEETDPDTRRKWMLLWQQEYVHDNPAPTLYLLTWIGVNDKRFQTPWGGPGDVPEWYDPYLNTWVEEPMPETVQLKFATGAGWWEYNPIFMWTMAQDASQLMTHSMLYVISREWGSAHGTGFYNKPYLAVGDPVFDWNAMTADVYLRDDVYWHNFTDEWTTPGTPIVYNNYQFDADDVICTFEALMDPSTASWGKSDYDNVLDVSVHSGGVEKIGPYQVRFHLLNPIAPECFKQLLANEWGVMILPEHIMGSVDHKDWYSHWTNREHPPPGTGPFQFVYDIPDAHWKLEALDEYPAELGGPHTIDEILGYVITEPAAAWTALMNHEIHYAHGGVWSATPEQIEAARADPSFTVFDDPIPATRNLAFNLRNPVLSNRYVRQAIAHAINYPHIVDTILPLAGLSPNCTIQASPTWPMMEWAYPTPADEVKYNIGPYEYNIAVAQQYMDMWNYSQVGTDYTLGPVGDNDFSGFVELDDFVIWAENVGTAPDDWPWYPGQDIDPDADNSDYVEMADFYRWRENFGEHYPFYGAR
jgi:ABC-type transport system substrate-binding protein